MNLKNKEMEKTKEIPAWLETLRNVNPSLAERAEADIKRWGETKDKDISTLKSLQYRIMCERDAYWKAWMKWISTEDEKEFEKWLYNKAVLE